jgi:response regulator RpfG family c-di-GMP phosphodiesterase
MGEAIPLGAEVISIADAFDAMTILKPQRRPILLEDILIELGGGRRASLILEFWRFSWKRRYTNY